MKLIVAPISDTGSSAVRALVAREVGPGVVYAHDEHGAPRLEGSDLRISVSHSRHWAVLALCDDGGYGIGVDIEEERTGQLRRVMHKFISCAELPIWEHRLLEAWTCKEAVYKAAGTPGLALADIDLTAAGEARLPDGRRMALHTVVTPDYTLTTAIELK